MRERRPQSSGSAAASTAATLRVETSSLRRQGAPRGQARRRWQSGGLSCAVAVILLCLQASVLAQRELHWEALTVTAHLNADGSLSVAEEQTMVFSGDW